MRLAPMRFVAKAGRSAKPAGLAVASALALSLGALALPHAACAYEVSPMIYDLKPTGKEANTTLQVRNDSASPITIEMVAERREYDERGQEKRIPADDDFVLFPPQAVIAAGKTQAVRVQYIGQPVLDRSTTYLVTVRQIPIALPTGSASGVQMIFNFSTMASVVPDGAKTKVELISAALAGDGVDVRLRNSGTKYGNIAASRLIVGGRTFEGKALLDATGPAWILPGHDRLVHLPGVTSAEGAQLVYVDQQF